MVMCITKCIVYKQPARRFTQLTPHSHPIASWAVHLLAIMRCVVYLERAGAISLLPCILYFKVPTRKTMLAYFAIAGGIAMPHTSSLRTETI